MTKSSGDIADQVAPRAFPKVQAQYTLIYFAELKTPPL